MRFDEKSKTISVLLAATLSGATVLALGFGAVSLSQSAAADTPNTQTTQRTPSTTLVPDSRDDQVSVLATSAEKQEARKKTDKPKKEKVFQCNNKLAKTLYRAGFRGHNIHEGWAIAMRESNGIPTTLSNGVDHGLFQFNYPAWGGQKWWNTALLLTPDYNAKIAFKLSDGGRNWGPWGMRDHAQWNFASYGMWSDWQIQNWIINPYMKYYRQYPCK